MWPPEYIQLKHIEDLMVCGICYEYINTSVVTSCSHNYCSLCIRKYLHYKTQCPTCFAETFEKDLRKNKVLDEIIAQFLQVKDKLKKCLKSPLQFLPGNKSDGFLNSPKSTHQKKYSPSVKQENASISRNLISANIASPSTNVQRDLSSPSTSGKNKIPQMFTPKSTKRQDPVSTDETKVVICPVCKVSISETNINRHLDDCLKREAKKDQVQIKIDEKHRQPLPKLVFSLMKDAVMRKKLKEFGLSAQGERKTMEARLQRYIVLYNAECDKSTPRSVSELIKQCEDEENLEKRINKTSLLNKLQVNRNTEQNVIDLERRKYLEEHKDSFENLIKQIKSSELHRNPTVRRNLLNESFEGNKRTVQKSEPIAESSDDSINDADKNEIPSMNSHAYIQDSDSDSACPLQMYSSSDPKKCLNIEFPCNNNAEINEIRSSYNDHVGEIEVKSDRVKSDTCSDISVCALNPLKHKISLKREERVKFSKDETRRMDFVSTRDNSSDQEDGDCEKHPPVLQNIYYDLSSNDSIDSKPSSGKSNAVNNGFLNNSLLNSSRVEKENISSSPECSGSRSYRKRNRDVVQNDSKTVYDVKKRLKKLSPSHLSETDESNEGSVSILYDDQETCLQNKTRLRSRNMNTTVVESTTVLRKSVRTKRKNNI